MRVSRLNLLKKILALVALLALISIPFFVRPYLIYGDSMYPALHDGDVVLTETLSLRFFTPQHGDIIAHRDPHKKDAVDVKRVIGLPGETVIVNERDVVITLRSGEEKRFGSGTLIGGPGDNGRAYLMRLGPEDYFVLGDNRRTSADSRSFGAVQSTDFIGRVFLRIPSIRN